MSRANLRRLLLRGLAGLPVPRRHPATPPRILLLRPDHLGDLLFMTPALHLLRTALPSAHITCLVGPWAKAVLADNPDVDELLTCDFPWFNRRPKASPWQPYVMLWQEAARLRRHPFDVGLIMRFDFWWGAALAYLAGIPRRIGYAVPDVALFLTEAVPYQPGLHEVVQNARLVSRLSEHYPFFTGVAEGAEAGRKEWDEGLGNLRFTITDKDAAWAAGHLTSQNDAQSSALLIAIHAGAGAAVKLWAVDRWVAVANALGQRYGARIVLTGGAGEASLVESIASRLTVPHINLAGETSLGQLAAVFARCRLVLGPDSGPLHLAVAAGAPTIHLFGPVDPRLFGPWGDPAHHIVIQARYFDVPCNNRPCNRLDYSAAQLPMHTCMETIGVDDVLQAAQRILSRA